jgi:predicted dehydrogenase
MMRVALIGNGKWGKNYIKAVEDSGIGVITTLVSPSNLPLSVSISTDPRSREPIETILKHFNISRENCDAAIVSTHPPLTESYTLELLSMGISVMAEKPFTFNIEALDQVQAILDNSDEKLIFLINHQHLFSKATQVIQNMLKGLKIEYFRAEAGGLGPYREYSPLWDYGPHDLSILAYLSKEILTLCHYHSFKENNGLLENIVLTTSGMIDARMSFWNSRLPKTHNFILKASGQTFHFDDFDPQGKIKIDGSYHNTEWLPPLSLSVEAFLTRIATKCQVEDLRFGTTLARSYTKILNDSGTFQEYF